MIKLNILVIAAHPDDAELGCAGTLLKEIANGKKVGIVDLTEGELGTRGSAEIRLKEAAEAQKVMQLSARENLGFRDGFFNDDEAHQLKIVSMLRKYTPDIVITNAVYDRHPDHGRGSSVVYNACFLSGLRKIETTLSDMQQLPWRPKVVYHFIQDRFIKPDFVVDITEWMDKKLEVLKAYTSQFYDPASKEPSSYISSPDFLDSIVARAREVGKPIGAVFGEGFTTDRYVGVRQLSDLL